MSSQALDDSRYAGITEQGNMEVRKALLKALGKDTEQSLVTRLADAFTERRFGKEDPILLSGERWREVLFIGQGMLRLCYSDRDGREFNKGFFREGQLIWPIAPGARQAPSLFSILCLEPCSVWITDFEWFRQQLESVGLWSRFALPFTEWLAEEKFLREYELLLYPAMDRYWRFRNQCPELADRVPDYHLASYLGMSNVTLSRIKRGRF